MKYAPDAYFGSKTAITLAAATPLDLIAISIKPHKNLFVQILNGGANA